MQPPSLLKVHFAKIEAASSGESIAVKIAHLGSPARLFMRIVAKNNYTAIMILLRQNFQRQSASHEKEPTQ